MALKGSESKNIIWDKLLEVFPNAFWEDTGKILRIPMVEDGARIEIKVSLTAAKINLKDDSLKSAFDSPKEEKREEKVSLEITEEEQNNIAKLMESLGL